MASCAACLQPIMRSQRFVLDGTEVFHAACAGQTYRSKQRITEAKQRETEAALADTRRAAARTEAELNIQRNLATSRHADVVQLEGRLSGERARREMLVQGHEELEAQLRAARAEIAALKAEAAARSSENQLQGADPEQDDASRIRFKLLELD